MYGHWDLEWNQMHPWSWVKGVPVLLDHWLIKSPYRYGSHSRHWCATLSRSVTRRL